MSAYDQQCARKFAQLQSKLAKYFIEVNLECPYKLPYTATFYQGMFGPVPEKIMEVFLAAGYRRNGNYLYTMHCRDCQACIPIRLFPQGFSPTRNQKRVKRKNSDIDISMGAVEGRIESLDLCEKFLQFRYPNESNSAAGYYSGFFYNTIATSMEIRYLYEERLIGTGIVDVGSNWMNAVYFFFDPDEGKRSPGTFNILTMVDMCRRMNIEYLYLGYQIDQVAAMNYKRRFKPHHLYLDSRWQRVED